MANCCDGFNKQKEPCVLENCTIIGATIIDSRMCGVEVCPEDQQGGGGALPDGIVTDLKIDNTTKVMTWKVDGEPKSYDLAGQIAQDTFVTAAILDGTTLELARNDGVTLSVDLSSLNTLPPATAGNALERLAVSETGEVVWMRTNLPSLVYNSNATQVINPVLAHGRLVHIDPGPTTTLRIDHGGGQDELFYIVNRTTRDLIVTGMPGVGINAVIDAVGSQTTGFTLKRYGTIAVRTSVNNAKIWGDLLLKANTLEQAVSALSFSRWGKVDYTMEGIPYEAQIFPNYTDDDRRKKLGINPANGELAWLPFALGTVVIGGTGLLSIDPLTAHGMQVQINQTSTATGFRVGPGTIAGEIFTIANRDEDTPLAIEVASGLTVQAHAGALRTPTGGVQLMPTGIVWVRATNTSVTIWGDLTTTAPRIPEITAGTVANVLITDMDASGPKWSGTPTMVRGVITLGYDELTGGDTTIGWKAPVPETTSGGGSTVSVMRVDPVNDGLGMAHYITRAGYTSIEIANQLANDRRAVTVTNTGTTALPIVGGAGVPEIVSAFGVAPYVKPGGTFQVAFDRQNNQPARCILWGDLQAAP